MKNLCFSLFLLFAVFSVTFAHAQEKPNYASANLQSVSKILFKKGILNRKDPISIEEYARIQYCGLYPKYWQDDFMWAYAVGAIGRQLSVDLPTFPDGLEAENILPLDRYDLVSNSFLVTTEGQLDNMGLITLLDFNSGSIVTCEDSYMTRDSFVPRTHPIDVYLKLDNPLTLQRIPMSRETADEIIDLMKKDNKSDRVLERNALLVMKITVYGLDPLTTSKSPLDKTLAGHLDEISVYEGPARKKLLFQKNFKSLKDQNGKN